MSSCPERFEIRLKPLFVFLSMCYLTDGESYKVMQFVHSFAMSLGPSEKQVKRELKEMRKAAKHLLVSSKRSRAFLKKVGVIK